MLIPVRLDENIKDVTVLVHGSPEVVPLPLDRDKDLVEVPCVPQLPSAMPQLSGKLLTKLQTLPLLADRLVADGHPALG